MADHRSQNYYISVGGDESRAKTRTRINQTVNAGLREEFGKRTVHDVVSGERDKIMADMLVKADADARKIGVQIVDVRFEAVELPTEVSDAAVYRRMEAERKRVANELRPKVPPRPKRFVPTRTGSGKSSSPKPIATLRRSRGEGDAKAAAIYSQAMGQEPEFYAFTVAWKPIATASRARPDVLVVEPDPNSSAHMKSVGRGGESDGKHR